ncbi:uncharacterized protein LOC134232128 [Saccostrea cucullata]|uniref:uncharacterized protein LOC134232128 n=1 Tax=Saccostrea cuccullata TaxID=36930 RepID=UPI002ED1077B
MAANTPKKYPLGSPQEHVEMCKTHELLIDMMCEDCDEFICETCAKTDHRNHDWKTISTAATLRRRGLLTFLKKIKKEDLHKVDEKLEKLSQRITENKQLCDSEMKTLQKHYDEIMDRLTEIKQRLENIMKDNLIKKNEQVKCEKNRLEKKKRGIVDTVDYLEENNGTMSDYSLIDNHRELTKLLSEIEVQMTNCEHSVRFTRGKINDDFLDSLVGNTLDLDDFGVALIKSFRYGEKVIFSMATVSENQCYLHELISKYLGKVNQQGIEENRFNIIPNDICVTDNSDIYLIDFNNDSINYLTPSGSVSKVISMDSLRPLGICQSVDGGLLVTLIDTISDRYELQSNSKRLLRHITVTGDVIHEYEYQEDCQTRLFTMPYRVEQNRNCDICVVNFTSKTTGELVTMSFSGHKKFIYRGQNLTENFNLADVACDSLCNILVTDVYNKQIHLLSPNGKFLKFLLTDNDENRPCSLSLYKSTLWVGYWEGLIKVFQFGM